MLRRTMSPAQIRAAVRSGDLTRISRGFYAGEGADPRIRRPIELGGRATCISALLWYGAWDPKTPETQELHYSPIRSSSRSHASRPGTVRVHAARSRKEFPGIVAPIQVAIRDTALCLPPEIAHQVLESLLTRNIILPSKLATVLTELSPTRQRLIGPITGYSGSGSESRVARWLWARGVRFAQQVHIPGVGRVDFLVGNRLIVEIDSNEFHSTPNQVREDRRRDFVARQLGYTVVRYSWHQVFTEWETVTAELARIISRKQHLRRGACR